MAKIFPCSEKDGIIYRRSLSINHESNNCKFYTKYMTPINTFLKFLGLLPVQKDHTGSFQWKLVSYIMIYSVITYIPVISLHGAILYHMLHTHSNAVKFVEKIMDASWIMSTVFMGLLPIINWTMTRRYVKYITKWQHFEAKYHEVVQDILETKNRETYFIFIFIAIYQVAVPWSYFTDKMLESLISYIYVPICIIYHLYIHLWNFHWYLSCSALCKAADSIQKSFEKDMEGSVFSVNTLLRYSSLWIEISGLVRAMGSVFSYSYALIISYMFLDVTLCTYFMLVCWIVGFQSIYIVICILNSSFMLFLFFNSAHKVTQKVLDGVENFSKLQVYTNDITSLSDRVIQGLVLNIQAFPPVISLSGFVTVNRKLMVSLAAMLITYMVILVQLGMSSGESYSRLDFLRQSDHETRNETLPSVI